MRLSTKREQERKQDHKITRLLMTSRRGSTLSDSKREREGERERESESEYRQERERENKNYITS